MSNENVKEQLIDTTVQLLKKSGKPGKITARAIAETAEVNLAMINYYFKSKDELMSIAVDKIISDSAKSVQTAQNKEQSPKERLTEFLTVTSDITFEYAELTRPVIPYLILEGEIDLPYQILPYVKDCFRGEKSDAECRTIAFQLVSFMQITFYRAEDYKKFSGIDLNVQSQRHQLYQMIINSLIADGKGAEPC